MSNEKNRTIPEWMIQREDELASDLVDVILSHCEGVRDGCDITVQLSDEAVGLNQKLFDIIDKDRKEVALTTLNQLHPVEPCRPQVYYCSTYDKIQEMKKELFG